MESTQPMCPGQGVFVWDEDWFHKPSHDIPPTALVPDEAPVLSTQAESFDEALKNEPSHDTTTSVSSQQTELCWFSEVSHDEPSTKKVKLDVPIVTPAGEDIPPTVKRSAQKVIRRWNLDRATKVIVGPEGVRFLNATDFTLSAEEWRVWCNECVTRELLLSEDRDDQCTLRLTEYGAELRRKRGLETTKFHLSKYQCSALDYRANYITDHLELLRENASPIHIMKSVIANKLTEMAPKMNLGMTYPVEGTFDALLENAVSLGITSEVLRDFSSEMRMRGMHCGLDHYSLFFYSMFQLSALRDLLM